MVFNSLSIPDCECQDIETEERLAELLGTAVAEGNPDAVAEGFEAPQNIP